jgi:hypothetical protein
MPSWRGAQFKHRDNFTFTLPLIALLFPLPMFKQSTLLPTPAANSSWQRPVNTLILSLMHSF